MEMKEKGNKILTKQDLIEKYGVVNVTPYYVEKGNGKICKPTICPQYRKNNGQLAYVVC